VLTGKYGDEGDQLLYRFADNGGRDVALRYDLTVPLARVVAQHRSLDMPFRRYQVAPVWRAEKPGAWALSRVLCSATSTSSARRACAPTPSA
jgi:histidyl-tRNA synthetase